VLLALSLVLGGMARGTAAGTPTRVHLVQQASARALRLGARLRVGSNGVRAVAPKRSGRRDGARRRGSARAGSATVTTGLASLVQLQLELQLPDAQLELEGLDLLLCVRVAPLPGLRALP